MHFKLLLIAFVLVYNAPISAQNTIIWSDSIVVKSSSQPFTAPRIALLKDGTPLITWGESGNFMNTTSQIWCSRYENGGFSAPVGVLPAPTEPSLFGFGGYDVAVSDSQLFLVFEQLGQGIFLARSDDGGLTFTQPTLVQGPIQSGYATLASVAVDGTGNPIVSYIRDKNGATYQIRRSLDGGLSFGDPVTASTPSDGEAVCECCTSDIQTSGDSVWLVFRNNNQNQRDIWVSRSTDLAANFDRATDVDATDWQLDFCPIAGPRMARSGDSLVTAWMSSASGIGRVYLSTLHAGTMESGQQVGFPASSPQAAQSLPDVVGLGDTIGIVFLERNKEIVFHYSTQSVAGITNQSTRFSVPLHTLQYPSIAFQNGLFHLVYADITADQILYRTGKLTGNSLTEEPKQTVALKLFPNPSTGIIHLEHLPEKPLSLRVWDLNGRPVKQIKDASITLEDNAINLGYLPNGVYMIQVKTANYSYWGKVLKY